MRRRQLPPPENHERWLVSYADFITLLFSFFVVMFASTQADRTKAKAVSDSVREALEKGQFSSAISTVLGRGKHEARKAPVTNLLTTEKENPIAPPASTKRTPADLAQYYDVLANGLEPEIASGKLQIKLEARGLVISLREATFFGSGNGTISPVCMPILSRIAKVVRQMPNPVRIEGHTDSRPIHNSRF